MLSRGLRTMLYGCGLNVSRAMSGEARPARVEEKSKSVGGARGDSCKDNSHVNRLVWVDLEMSGLELERDQILEMACIVTDADLNIVAEAPDLIIHHPDSVLDAMGDWCKEHHGKSGLTEAVRQSNISLTSAEDQMVKFVTEHVPKGSCPLAGNSIHVDKEFLNRYMPRFMSHLHYRIVDVSTLKELCRRWYPDVYLRCPPKALSHRALDDIKESIAELQHYRKTMLK
ncbi:oligoribonuclease, mitochondrial-like isoform X1 [Liolophura sinensis]|uniref:oligoribonuclease, mitochondrial-like isoform X1 n=1 Tax=Liolophura sinensis TaxID=3198878 RepID=UPI003158375B